jgi:3'(2'), 5'-bisphosphate nucleotidase
LSQFAAWLNFKCILSIIVKLLTFCEIKMTNQSTNLTTTLQNQLVEVACEAGAVIMGIYQEMQAGSVADVLLAQKSDDSPLTRADLLAHQCIARQLQVLTPHVAVVSEEDTSSLAYRQPTGDFWLIDPLDGTKEFLAQNGEFTVNIALVRDGRALFGVVVAPALGLRYWGGPGLGAFRQINGTTDAIRVSAPIAAPGTVRVVASKSHMNADTVDFIKKLGQHELIQAGSSLKFCRIAEGHADVYPRLGLTCEWDTAAAQAVVEGAGGYVCQLDGTPLRYGKPDVLNPYFVAFSTPLTVILDQPR